MCSSDLRNKEGGTGRFEYRFGNGARMLIINHVFLCVRVCACSSDKKPHAVNLIKAKEKINVPLKCPVGTLTDNMDIYQLILSVKQCCQFSDNDRFSNFSPSLLVTKKGSIMALAS